MGEAAARLYDEDFVAWTQEQAAALRDLARAGSNAPLDYEHLAEEIEGLGGLERRELRSRIETILEHLMKLQHAPAAAPRPGWQSTIIRSRAAVEGVLEDSPSLRRAVPAMIQRGLPLAARLVALDLEARGELTPTIQQRLAATTYDEGQVLGDWFPPSPPSA
jgi:hypothetical protein